MREHRHETDQAISRTRRDVGSYGNELDILLPMLNEFAVAMHIRFQQSEGRPADYIMEMGIIITSQFVDQLSLRALKDFIPRK